MNLDLSKLKKEVENYTKVLQEIEEHREIWAKNAKTLTLETLKAISEEIKLPWNVFQSQGYVNHEAVGLIFKNIPSGVVKKEAHSIHAYIKFGGSLAFSQSYNGEINVIVNYPFVDKWTDKHPAEKITTVSPEKIDADFIVKQVEIFLDKIADWELKTEDTKIGFDFLKDN